MQNTSKPIFPLINGYGRYLRQRKLGESAALRESSSGYHVNDENDSFADLPP
jgi:hypothetical protein